MNTENYILVGVFCFLLGVIGQLIPFPKRNYLYMFPAAGAAVLIAAGLSLSSGSPVFFRPVPISSVLDLVFYGDSLAGFFVAVISVLTLSVSVYSIGYTKDVGRKALMGFLFNLFALSMYAVILSGNVITFLISWETMSVASYFLVTFDRDGKSAKAGLVYAVMTHMGTAFLIALFLILYKYTGAMDFQGMRALMAGVPASVKTIIFIFSLVGFGTKAGIVPLHTWLPKAHPAAPSNVSALMSGVMIKTGIYGFVRIGLDVMGQGPNWWGLTVIAIGAVSAILGVLYALMEHDIKKLLAYHSVENIGIILLGIGASMMFGSDGLPGLASIALIAGLYHTVNHALFKGLLFLGAGSVVHATGTKNMEEMGGLIKSMPYTALTFLIGSVSICALPPFNGFVSEWLTYQSLILGFRSSSITAKIISPLGGAALALTGALAAACFVKAFGISFLGAARSRHSEGAQESSPSMIAGMAVLAMMCLALGLLPGVVLGVLSGPAFLLTGSHGIPPGNWYLQVNETLSGLSPAAILVTVIVMAAATRVFLSTVGSGKKTTYRDPWDCGIPALTPRMQYTATAFTKPIRMIFKRIYLPKRELRVSYIVKPFFVRTIRYSGEITPVFEKYLYESGTAFIHRLAGKVKMLQSGSLHLYLGYILLTLILLLIFVG